MKIDLNNPKEFTLENVRKLIASEDDKKHRQLRVTNSGEAFISDVVGSVNISDLAFRLETWCQGNDYCGKKASEDDKWVERVYRCLKDNWPNPSSSYIDVY